MKVGLIDIDSKGSPRAKGGHIYPNLALCKIARYHRKQGDVVEWATPFEHYGIIYMAKVFNFSPDVLTC